jgi:hypothetical protein
MTSFFTTPIFFLTPYIFLWSIFNGLLTIALLKLLNIKTSGMTKLATSATTAIASILWNWSITFNQSTIYLNVDHPYLRISWADILNGVCVFAFTSLVLGLWVGCKLCTLLPIRVHAESVLTTFVEKQLFQPFFHKQKRTRIIFRKIA